MPALRKGPPRRGPTGGRAAPPAGDGAARVGYDFHAGRSAAAPRRRGAHALGADVDARMSSTRETATYLYCLVTADRRPSLTGAPRGLAGTGPLRTLEADQGLWLIVSDAPLSAYGSEPIERNMRDLEWVAMRGAAHARMIEYFARRATTLPMKLFTLFASDERAAAHVRGDAGRIRRVLTRV